MIVLAAVVTVPFVVGWVLSLTGGTPLAEDTERPWDGELWYVAPDTGLRVVCTLVSPDGASTALATEEDPPRGGWNPADTQRQLAADGFLARSDDGPPATLRCSDDVRVLTGPGAALGLVANSGLWVVGPVAVLVATGGALRRGPSAT
jgi:hypothetical protein